MFKFTDLEIFPPWSPFFTWGSKPSTISPSLNQVRLAAGKDDEDSQVRMASLPAFRGDSFTFTTTFDGGTVRDINLLVKLQYWITSCPPLPQLFNYKLLPQLFNYEWLPHYPLFCITVNRVDNFFFINEIFKKRQIKKLTLFILNLKITCIL